MRLAFVDDDDKFVKEFDSASAGRAPREPAQETTNRSSTTDSDRADDYHKLIMDGLTDLSGLRKKLDDGHVRRITNSGTYDKASDRTELGHNRRGFDDAEDDENRQQHIDNKQSRQINLTTTQTNAATTISLTRALLKTKDPDERAAIIKAMEICGCCE